MIEMHAHYPLTEQHAEFSQVSDTFLSFRYGACPWGTGKESGTSRG
jgi:hypothetical protein